MQAKPLLIIIVTFIFSHIAMGQYKIPDSLKNKSFEELKKLFLETESNHRISYVYAKSYIEKAKVEKDTFNIAYGYIYKSYLSDFEEALKYTDSILQLTRNYKNIEFPALGFMLKGYYYYAEGQDKIALEIT